MDRDSINLGGSTAFKHSILFMQFLLFCISVILPMRIGMDHMNAVGIISVALDLMAMFVLMLIFRNICNGRLLNNTYEISRIIITVFFCVFFEVGIWVFDGLEEFRTMNYICNIGSNCLVLLGTYLYFLFIKKAKGINTEIFPKLKWIMGAVLAVGIAAEILNYFWGYFYEIDAQGVYIRSTWGSYLGYLPFLIMLGGCVVFIIRQKIVWKTKLSYMSYFIFPLLCSVWYTLTGYPPTFFVAAAMSVLLIHGDIYVLQGKETEFFELENAKNEAECALIRNMLMLSQIKPHFLYNSLGNIEVLCKINPEKAGQAIHHFTQYLRSNMDVVKNTDTIPFSKELEHIRNYVWLEQMRFEDVLEYKEDIEVVDFRVTQLSIQPIVENAIKHGMMGDAEGVLHVTLMVEECENAYVIRVCDDGCGFDPTKVPDDGRSHIGIGSASYSLKMRLNGAIDIDSRIGEGTTVTITIPKN